MKYTISAFFLAISVILLCGIATYYEKEGLIWGVSLFLWIVWIIATLAATKPLLKKGLDFLKDSHTSYNDAFAGCSAVALAFIVSFIWLLFPDLRGDFHIWGADVEYLLTDSLGMYLLMYTINSSALCFGLLVVVCMGGLFLFVLPTAILANVMFASEDLLGDGLSRAGEKAWGYCIFPIWLFLSASVMLGALDLSVPLSAITFFA